MDILILTNFTSTFSKTDNDRFLYLAKILAKENEVEIVTSDFCHEKKEYRRKTESKWSFKITFLHEAGYSKNVCFKRFYSHFIWGKSVKKYLDNRKKPDVIYCAVPSISAPYKAAQYCKKNNIRFIIDVQDLWPEAFKMVFNIPLISSLLFWPFKWIANKVYSSADAICAVSSTYADRALSVNNRCEKGTVVFLGTDLNTFDENASTHSPLIKNDGEVWLAYCGTLGSSYDLKIVVDALSIIKNPPRFIIMGDGYLKNDFELYAEEKEVKCEFLGRVAYDQMCAVLTSCDIVVNPIVHNVAQSIINKYADYAALGLPVINTQECEEYRNLVDKYQMGFNCKKDDVIDLSDKIKVLTDNQKLRIRMGNNARRCAEEKFNRQRTYSELTNLVGGVPLTKSGKWLGYCGTLGSSYDIPLVIDALSIINKQEIEPLLFVVMGDGPKYQEYKTYAIEKNVFTLFTGRIPYDEMCGVLHQCDIVVNPIKGGSAATIINKHADYAASGVPCVNTQDSYEYRKLVEEYRMGYNCSNANAEELADKLKELLCDKTMRDTMGIAARKCAEEKFDRRNTYSELVDVIIGE